MNQLKGDTNAISPAIVRFAPAFNVIQFRSPKHLVLIADRDVSILLTFQVALVSHGYQTVVEQSALGTLERIQQAAIELVVLDPHHFGIDGTYLVRKIRELRPDLPILIVSYDPIPEFADAPLIHFLAKPTMPASIRSAVDSLIDEISHNP